MKRPKRPAIDARLADPAIRWFMDCDHDGHDYLVPESIRAEWERWIDLSEDDDESFTPPHGVIPIDCFNTVTFTLPRT